MKVIKSKIQLRKILGGARRKGRNIGFVPTMGYFHDGHLRLMRRAKRENDMCVVSVYVNPKQFGPTEDLSKYPRDFERDSSLARKENVDIMYVPSDNDVYPQGYLTYIDVEKLSNGLCGAFRPGHFRGVATVVAKLLNIVQPDTLYLGAKDAQQAAVLKAMVRDLNFPVQVKVVPTSREPGGLAMSSRNVRLSPADRAQAAVIPRALEQARQRIKAGERSAAKIAGLITGLVRKTRGNVQYVACVDADTLEPLKALRGRILIAVAVFFGKTRLIDNAVISVDPPGKK